MPYDENLARRVREEFARRSVQTEEKRMMGGLCFMVDAKMCVGVEKSRLMVRLDPDHYVSALTLKGCAPMDFTGRPMGGFVWVDQGGIASAGQLRYWIDQALAYNPKAKASKRRGRARR